MSSAVISSPHWLWRCSGGSRPSVSDALLRAIRCSQIGESGAKTGGYQPKAHVRITEPRVAPPASGRRQRQLRLRDALDGNEREASSHPRAFSAWTQRVLLGLVRV